MKKKKVVNPVAKFAGLFNRSTVEVDRKKRDKRGYQKYKGKGVPEGEAQWLCFVA